MYRRTNLIFLFLSILFLSNTSKAQTLLGAGGGPVELGKTICVTPEQRVEIEERLRVNIEALTAQGLLKPESEQSRVVTKFAWPLQQAEGFDQPNYYTTNNYTDLDPNAGILDYNCGARSYNGHRGIDFNIWPFWWDMMEKDQVEVIAGAPGTIISKDDGQFDQNCTCTGSWNAVYVQHADGSVAWYGHLKKNSLTTKEVGQTVEEGDYIGVVGSSGCSSNPHLHFEIRQGGTFVEGYEGSCNNTTTESWYKEQKPYREPKLNRLMTHSQNPEWNGFCPQNEMTDFLTEFDPGITVRFAAYYSDQTAGTVTDYVIKDAHGDTYMEWSHSSDQDYTSPFWYWIYDIPMGVAEGTWTFEASFANQTVVHEFLVGADVSSTTLLNNHNVQYFPNPTNDLLNIQMDDLVSAEYQLKSKDGKLIRTGKISNSKTNINLKELTAGLYIIELLDEDKNYFSREKIIKLN